jgi:hypothetical protein
MSRSSRSTTPAAKKRATRRPSETALVRDDVLHAEAMGAVDDVTGLFRAAMEAIRLRKLAAQGGRIARRGTEAHVTDAAHGFAEEITRVIAEWDQRRISRAVKACMMLADVMPIIAVTLLSAHGHLAHRDASSEDTDDE